MSPLGPGHPCIQAGRWCQDPPRCAVVLPLHEGATANRAARGVPARALAPSREASSKPSWASARDVTSSAPLSVFCKTVR